MAGKIIVSEIQTDNDNNVVIRANTGEVLFRVTDAGLDVANSVPSGSITSDMIADGTVIAADVADGSITTAKIADGNVTVDKIASGSITTDKIADANVTNDKIVSVANTKITGNITSSQIEPDASLNGDVTVTGNISTPGGVVTASSFSGDGSSLTGIAGGFSNIEVFTSPGTWTNPGSVTKVKVTVVGGGGDGQNRPSGPNGPGGAGGGAAIEVIPFPSGTNVSVTVGGAAGTSSFGAYCSATGGANGPTSVTTGAAGGAGSGGNINFTGSSGGIATNSYPADVDGTAFGGDGGSSILGQGAAGSRKGRAGGGGGINAAGGYGAGGGGSAYLAPHPLNEGGLTPSSSGTPGVVIVEY